LVRVWYLEDTSKKIKAKTYTLLLNILFDKILISKPLYIALDPSALPHAPKVTPKYVTFSFFFSLFAHLMWLDKYLVERTVLK